MLSLFRRTGLRQNFKEVLADLLGVIAVSLTDEPDGIWQQDMALCFLRFVFLPLFVYFICDLLHGGYLDKLEFVRLIMFCAVSCWGFPVIASYRSIHDPDNTMITLDALWLCGFSGFVLVHEISLQDEWPAD